MFIIWYECMHSWSEEELTIEDQVTCECGNEPLGSIKCGEFLD